MGVGLWAVLSLALAWPTFASPQIVIPESFQELTLDHRVELLFDPSSALTLNDLRAGKGSWELAQEGHSNFGFRDGALWARFRLEDRRPEGSPALILEQKYALADYVDVYVVGEGRFDHFKAGWGVARQDWALPYRLPAFLIGPSRSHEIYVRISGDKTKKLSLHLWSQDRYQVESTKREVYQALYYGALLALLFYNLLLGLSAGLRDYFYYVAFLSAFCLFQAAYSGHGHLLVWGDREGWNDLAMVFGLSVGAIASQAFALKLLEIPRQSRLVQITSRTVTILSLISIGLHLLMGFSFAVRFAAYCITIPWVFSLALYGVIAYRAGSKLAVWYGIAWSIFILGTVCLVLAAAGYIPFNAFTSNAQQIGSALEFLLLSFALAERIKTLQKDLQAQQEQALLAEKHAREADQRALAEERRMNEERDQLVANTSHELRTPLNGMMGLAQAILRQEGDRLSTKAQHNLEALVSSGKRLAGLLDDLLDFSRAQLGGIVLHKATIRIEEQIDHVCRVLQSSFDSKNVQLERQLPADLPPVLADPDRTQQILFNLLGNALKFTDHGSVTVRAKVEANRVIVSVDDTGPGIDEKDYERIFHPFVQGDGSISRRYGGTGLGLAIVKTLVAAQDGQVGIQSTLDRGSTFWFSLPLGEGSATPSQPALLLQGRETSSPPADVSREPDSLTPLKLHASRQATPVQDATTFRILVVDDEAINRNVLAELLIATGYSLSFATSGAEAMRLMEQGEVPQLVLLDVMMPGVSGFEVLTWIRERFHEAELPVILLTAKALPEDIAIGFSLGASDYIVKPFLAREIEARILHQIRLHTAIQRGRQATLEGSQLRSLLSHTEDKLLHAERLATIGVATAGIAHDLCNPLQHLDTILGWIQDHNQNLRAVPALPAPALSEIQEVEQAVTLGQKAVRTANDLTRALQLAARSDEGSEELLPMREIVEDVLLILNHKLKYIRVEHTSEPDLLVSGRRSEYIQLLMNLISNAADAALSSPIKALGIRVQRQGQQITVRIDDSGPGIPEAQRQLIFEPFYTTKPPGQGTGLGLAVVQTILKRQGGHLAVDSSPELGGASFQLTLPAAS